MNPNHLDREETFKFVLWTDAVYCGQGIFQILLIVLARGVQRDVDNLLNKGAGQIAVLRSKYWPRNVDCLGRRVHFDETCFVKGNRVGVLFLEASWQQFWFWFRERLVVRRRVRLAMGVVRSRRCALEARRIARRLVVDRRIAAGCSVGKCHLCTLLIVARKSSY